MQELLQAIKDALGNYNFLILYAVCLVVEFILLKGRRKIFLISAVLVTVFILMPQFYDKWNELNDYAYWRILWMIPVIPVCAVAPAVIIEKVNKEWIKPLVVLTAVVVIMITGSFIYKNDRTTFKVAKNYDKLPDDVCDVAELLLKKDNNPTVVSDSSISVYLRQYSGRFITPYGRDIVYGGGASNIAKELNEEISASDGDMERVSEIMLNYGYDYLVTNNTSDDKKQNISAVGFGLLGQIGDYGVYKVHGNPTEIRTFNENNMVSSVTSIDEKGNPKLANGGYATAIYEYDKYGHITKEFHLDIEGNGVTDANGRAGYKRTYDRLGNILTEINLDQEGNPTISRGYSERKCEYNEDNHISKESFYDNSGNPMINTNTLYFSREIRYDDEERVVGERYYDTKGNMIISKDGYAGYDRTIDLDNKKITDTYIGIDDKPMVTKEGYVSTQRDCNSKGYVITKAEDGSVMEEVYLDINGKEIPNRVGCSRIKKTFDGLSNSSETLYMQNGEKFITSNGCVKSHRDYDEDGNVVREYYYDADDQFTMITAGYVIVEYDYDKDGRVIGERYYDENSKPSYSVSGYAALKRSYDKNGNMISESYYDDKGDSIACVNGFDELRREYNDKYQLISESYFDDDKPVCRTDKWYHELCMEYDEAGDRIKEEYYDIEGNPVINSSGYASVIRKYDDRHRMIEEDYIDEYGEPVYLYLGYSILQREYNETGQPICDRYLDGDRKPVLRRGGYASIKWEYNDLYQTIKESYFDVDGKPVLCDSGYASVNNTFDNRNNITKVEYLDMEGEPILRDNGYASVERVYNDRSQAVEEHYFDTDDNPIELDEGYSGLMREYSYAGDIVYEKLVDKNDKTVLRDTGYAGVRRVYSSKRKLLTENYEDENGKSVSLGQGYSTVEYTYNNAGYQTLIQYIDTNGNLKNCDKGYAQMKNDYSQNKMTESVILDRNGNEINSAEGYSKVKYEYRTDGQLSVNRFYNTEGTKLERGSGYLHDYLQNLKNKNVTVFMAIKDEGTAGLTATLNQDLKDLGIKTNLRGKDHCSYYAVIAQDNITEGISNSTISHKDSSPIQYEIYSSNWYKENYSSIIINGSEYSKNVRGLNITIYDNDNNEVVDTFGIDTYTSDMVVTK